MEGVEAAGAAGLAGVAEDSLAAGLEAPSDDAEEVLGVDSELFSELFFDDE